MSTGRRAMQTKFTILAGLIFATFCLWLMTSSSKLSIRTQHYFSPEEMILPTSLDLPCRNLPNVDDIVVIMKTGSTELIDKLPIHLRTTLRCYANYLIFSDHEEEFEGVHILDALESVNSTVKAEHVDFELWRRLHDDGRTILQPSELSGPLNRPHGGGGKGDNPGWVLDKWKFLPMVNRTLSEHPNKKWYLFVETDTYIFWQTALEHLAKLDWMKPYYLGNQMQIGDVIFAHGGSGFAVSRPAMELVTQLFSSQQKEWEDFIDGHWAGDCVLGKAFLNAGVTLTWAGPVWQGMPVSRVDYHKANVWCSPTVSYHHTAPTVIEDMWNFEQESIIVAKEDGRQYLTNRDVFTRYVMPLIADSRQDWENYSGNDQGMVDSLDTCHTLCQEDESCIQYMWSNDTRCLTADSAGLGEEASGFASGWISERIDNFLSTMGACPDYEGWPT